VVDCRAVYRQIVDGSVAARGERAGVASAKRHAALLPEALRGPVRRALALAQTRALIGDSSSTSPPELVAVA
jgi:hypothetical protein